MKFGQSLNDGSIPEWKDQYVDYKVGKKQIKKVAFLHKQLAEDRTSDVTPLLESLSHEGGTIPGLSLGHGAVPPPKNDETSSKRRASLFNLSMKSVKNKKEEFLIERSTFLQWLSSELSKVDGFYVEKEKDVYERFLVLEDQFYQLKDHKLELSRRVDKVPRARKSEPINLAVTGWRNIVKNTIDHLNKYDFPSLPSTGFLKTWKASRGRQNSFSLSMASSVETADFDPNYRENQIRNGQLRVDSNIDDDIDLIESDSDNQQDFSREEPSTAAQAKRSRRRDYVRKKHFGVPYYYAKTQLKKALIEHYRAISLIRSYKEMNRTAFRKITKKYDKALDAKVSESFMKKVDDESYFQNSTVLDTISSRIEDLFLTFFESDTLDRKHSLERLRSATYVYNNADVRLPLFYKTVFLSGIYIGIGAPLFVIGLYKALEKTLGGELPEGKSLLQIWGGYFLVNMAFLFIGINMMVFEAFKINYKFIFEFNLTTALDYKQFFMLPSFAFGLLGLLGWFSFQDFWPSKFPGRDWPLIFLGVMLLIFLNPTSRMFGASRKWLQIAIWRLMCSGFYPVEFRDFFLGDILCSLTYSMGNLYFFFCLYTSEWRKFLGGGSPPSLTKCGSSHSRAMGFLSTLPSIWRFLQCLRRYMDSGDAFPHLANMLKYLISIAYYALLSNWRIERKSSNRAIFIVIACLNSILSSAWDIVMDWSLGQVQSKHFLLRDHLFYEKPAYYYTAIIMDVILRFQWIFYAFFSNQIQQLAVTSFCIALAEIFRRFIWVFFRLENEHCTNVILFRASRDSPLPYRLPVKVERAIKKLVATKYGPHEFVESDARSSIEQPPSQGRTTSYSTETNSMRHKRRDGESLSKASSEHPNELLRRRSTLANISNALNKAHIKDFQRKKYNVQLDESDEDEEEADE